MIPISLTIEGLYSYRKRQHIDFEKLTSNQLFGIFGSVGSGKSSILEAIIFAIFNESDRLNKAGDNRYYNMMNLQSNYLLIDFICFAGNLGEEKYRFIFEAKRSKKHFEEVKTPDRRVLKEVDGNWQAQENYDTTKIIGMNAKNFRQTVIIPQGKFRDFIEMGGADRTKMLQELFQLDKFDLAEKTRKLIAANHEQIIKLETRLEGLAQFTTESLQEKENKAIELQKEISIESNKLKEQKMVFERELRLKELLQEKEEINNWLKNHEANKNHVVQHEKFLDKYDLADRLFKEKLIQEGKLLNQINLKDTDILSTVGNLRKVEQEFNENLAKYKQIKLDYDQRDEKQIKLNDLEIIIRIRQSEEELQAIINSYEGLKKQSETSQKKLQKAQDIENQLVDKLKQLKGEKKDINWLKDAEGILASEGKEKRNINTLESGLNALKQQITDIKEKQLSLTNDIKDEVINKLDFAEYVQKQLTQFTQELIELETHKKYESDRVHLKEGMPCPLCGAEHHPANHAAHNTLDLAQIINKIENVKEKQQTFETTLRRWQEFEMDLSQQKAVVIEKEKAMKVSVDSLKEITNKIKEKTIEGLTLKDILAQLAEQENLTEQVSSVENKLENVRLEINENHKLLDGAKEAFTLSETNKRTTENSIERDKKLLKILAYEGKLIQLTLDQLKASQNRGIKQLAEVETNYKEAEKKNSQLQLEKKGLESTLTLEQQYLSSLRKDVDSLRNEIYNIIDKENDFTDLQEVKHLLKKNVDQQKERANINAFKNDWQQKTLSLQDISHKTGGENLDFNAHSDLKNEIAQGEQNLTSHQNALAIINQQINESIEQITLKKEHESKLRKCHARASNLKIMASMFKAKGFVEFASSIYLKNLVGIANERFMKLTKNNLSLELNESNDFIVRDYLNNGKARLLKTLSGGQTFQAALCLALALAEHVKALNTSERSFFFLDEGFGTLDRQSLQVVFETLRALQKENRIVGVISHVEELQQEIEVALLIDNDQEDGSRIRYSWL